MLYCAIQLLQTYRDKAVISPSPQPETIQGRPLEHNLQKELTKDSLGSEKHKYLFSLHACLTGALLQNYSSGGCNSTSASRIRPWYITKTAVPPTEWCTPEQGETKYPAYLSLRVFSWAWESQHVGSQLPRRLLNTLSINTALAYGLYNIYREERHTPTYTETETHTVEVTVQYLIPFVRWCKSSSFIT